MYEYIKNLEFFMWHKTDLVYLYEDNGYFPTLVYFPTLSPNFERFQKLLYFIYFRIFCIILKIIKIFQKLTKKYTNNNF